MGSSRWSDMKEKTLKHTTVACMVGDRSAWERKWQFSSSLGEVLARAGFLAAAGRPAAPAQVPLCQARWWGSTGSGATACEP